MKKARKPFNEAQALFCADKENLDRLSAIMKDIAQEVVVNCTSFPLYRNGHEGHSIIREEFEEFWDEIKKDDGEKAIAEAKQLAATVVKFIYSFGYGKEFVP